jgi:hypothetical protein
MKADLERIRPSRCEGLGRGAAVALHFMHYNFAHIHKTLQVTPAMAANVSDQTSGASTKLSRYLAESPLGRAAVQEKR